jgi:hypothetical protein
MPHRPTCPRCGYDQTGIVASWEDSCPLDGICSECGLEFAWKSVLSPKIVVPRWYVETERLPIRTFFLTMARTLAPPTLWRHIRLELLILRPGRLAAYIAFWMLALHAIVTLALYGLAWLDWYNLTKIYGPRYPKPSWDLLLWPYGWMIDWYYWNDWQEFVIPFILTVGWAVTMPVLYFLFNESLKIERVRFMHLVRIAALSIPVAMLGGIAINVFTKTIDLLGSFSWIGVVLILLAWFGWPSLYWLSASRRYLRLKHPFFAVALLGFTCTLLSVAWVGLFTIIFPTM